MRITENNIQDIFKAQSATVEHMERLGYTLITELFCDSSGLGQEGESALTQNKLIQEVKNLIAEHGTLTAKITGSGQFQVYLGLFKRTGEAHSKAGSNRDVAEAYANGEVKHSLHMFIEYGTIYSYGSHFPMAYRTGKYNGSREIVLINSDGYSVTTSKHQGLTRYALHASEFVEVPTQELKAYIQADQNGYLVESTARRAIVESLTKTIEELRGKASRARKEWNKTHYSEQAQKFSEQVNIVKNILIPLHPKHV